MFKINFIFLRFFIANFLQSKHLARDNWEKRMGERELEELTKFGGMSGGPIFLFVDGVLHLVGVIFQDLGKGLWGEGLQAVHAHFIKPDGSIEQL
ncbi:hypothetical protein [Paenibacillus odorifer]|uniref:hypothetical protein n=1 Tax=Paenibacillus odorifer TaxID=189426 RepID=UPI00117C9BFD|nr:hypothetical protein [Paenibacillus odorifer]